MNQEGNSPDYSLRFLNLFISVYECVVFF